MPTPPNFDHLIGQQVFFLETYIGEIVAWRYAPTVWTQQAVLTIKIQPPHPYPLWVRDIRNSATWSIISPTPDF